MYACYIKVYGFFDVNNFKPDKRSLFVSEKSDIKIKELIQHLMQL